MHDRGQSFGAITVPFLPQVFSLPVLILTVSPGFKFDRQFWVSGSIAVLVVEGLGCGLPESRFVRIGWLNNLSAGDDPHSSGLELKNSIGK